MQARRRRRWWWVWVLVGPTALAGIILAALDSLIITSRTYRLTQQGQLTDCHTKVIEQLRSDKLDGRLGGIYALERIAKDSAQMGPLSPRC